MSRIIELQIENVKRLTAVRITPGKKHLVKIGGDNEQGKSSVLDSIAIGLQGADASPEVPLHHGADKASIILRTPELVITRTYTERQGWKLVVTNPDGMEARKPQSLIDTLTGKHTFDPASFLKLKPDAQRDALMRVLGLNFTEEDAQRKQLFDERTHVNRDHGEAESVLANMPAIDASVPDKETSTADLDRELKEAQKVNDAAAKRNQEVSRLATAVTNAKQAATTKQEEIDRVDLDIQRLQRRRRELETELAAAQSTIESYTASHDQAKKHASEAPRVDIIVIGKKFSELEATNAKVRANLARKAQEKKVKTLAAEAAELTASIELLDKRKSDAVAAAKFPVPGLSFTDQGVLFKGFPLAQASTAAGLRLSVAIGCAMNPKLRVMFIRDGSLMDDKSLALLNDLAEEFDAQVWIERVGTKDKTAVIIEDGTNL